MKVNMWREVMVSAMPFVELTKKEQRRITPKIRECLFVLKMEMADAGVTVKDEWLLLMIPQEQGTQSRIFGVALVKRGVFPRPTRAAGLVFNESWGVLRQAGQVQTDRMVKNEMRPVLERVIQRVVLQDRKVQDAVHLVHVALPQFRNNPLQVVRNIK